MPLVLTCSEPLMLKTCPHCIYLHILSVGSWAGSQCWEWALEMFLGGQGFVLYFWWFRKNMASSELIPWLQTLPTCQTNGPVWGVGLKHPHYGASVGPHFQVFSKNCLSLLLWGSQSTIALITPFLQASTCGKVLAPGQTQTAPKQWKLDVHVKS